VGLSVLKKVGVRKILSGDEFFLWEKEENFLKRRRFSKLEWSGGRILLLIFNLEFPVACYGDELLCNQTLIPRSLLRGGSLLAIFLTSSYFSDKK